MTEPRESQLTLGQVTAVIGASGASLQLPCGSCSPPGAPLTAHSRGWLPDGPEQAHGGTYSSGSLKGPDLAYTVLGTKTCLI